jgi:hypothetical protein
MENIYLLLHVVILKNATRMSWSDKALDSSIRNHSRVSVHADRGTF